MTDPHQTELETRLIPERSREEWGIAFLVFGLSVLYLWPFRAVTELFQDEGIVLQGAQRILEGEVLYRDFFSFYTPGSFYWQALLFKVFGSSYLVARTLLPLYGGVFSLLTYLLARRVCNRWSAILGAYLFLVIGLPYRFLHLHNWDSLVLAYVGIYCAVRQLEAPKNSWAFATGTFVSLTILFEHSKGTGLLIGLGLGLAALALAGRGKGLVRLPALLAGLAWPFVPVLIYFASQHALSPMIADWTWPLFHYSESNKLPYGWINISPQGWEALFGSGTWTHRLVSILFMSPCFVWPMIPFAAIVFLAIHALRLKWGNAEMRVSGYFVVVSAGCVGLTLSAIATGRPDVQHLIFAGAPFSVVLAWVLGGAGIESTLLEKVRPLLVVYCLVFFTAFGLAFWIHGPLDAPHRLETRRGSVRLSRPDEVIPYLTRHVASGEKIFVYPQQPLYYFLTATRNPTRFDFLQLGMHSQEEFQQVIAELAADRTKLVIWDLPFNTDTILQGWPATRLETLANDPIKDFILANYRPCTTLRSVDFRYVVLVRKDLACEK
jgi:4-amino-4-deoxy-L-arabinose transferase-like glycosyltransferase